MPESEVMAVWICLALSVLISSISIYYASESDIRVIIYDHFNFSTASFAQFRASRYIIDLNRTSESKVIAVWICLALWCLISRILIYYAPESNIWVKIYYHFNFSRASFVQFQEHQYIIGLNRTSESKVMTIWICWALWCLILRISIYYALESDLHVKSYDNLNFSRAYVVPFRTSRYIIGWNRTSASKVTAVWICFVLPF